ncbi:hypothetical protein D1164_13395 [Mariniphaga sediminis]|uniref:Uncharacterized protein n=1 Tax=Mariniphaga sediminis TaxID=1628158 RepID=A0A399CZP9_9BACT|nr:hypothetical protein D1164_13395 [Mariniphaga sediminis]
MKIKIPYAGKSLFLKNVLFHPGHALISVKNQNSYCAPLVVFGYTTNKNSVTQHEIVTVKLNCRRVFTVKNNFNRGITGGIST